MKTRHDSRFITVQALFQWAMGNNDLNQLVQFGWVEEYITPEVRNFAETLLRGTIETIETIDSVLETMKHELQLYRLSEIDRAILRLAIYSFEPSQQPLDPPVIINESIELAKELSDKDNYKLINRAVEWLAIQRGWEIAVKPLQESFEVKSVEYLPKKKIKIKRLPPKESE